MTSLGEVKGHDTGGSSGVSVCHTERETGEGFSLRKREIMMQKSQFFNEAENNSL